MHRVMVRKFSFIVLLTLAAGLMSFAFGAERAEGDSFTIRLEAPQLRTVVDEEGGVEVRADGFETRELRPGYPDLPFKTLLVAIPPGAEPRLEIRDTGPARRVGVRPRPVPRVILDPAAEVGGVIPREQRDLIDRVQAPRKRIYRADSAIYERDTVHPAQVAWLGDTGVLRDQRYVEVHFAPIRYDGAADALQVVTSLEVTIHFAGGPAASRSATSGAESRFEPVYRKAFANYDQGRTFRLPRAKRPAPIAAAGSAAVPRWRLRVGEDRPVRLDHTFLQANAAELIGTNPLHWRLSARGDVIPLQIHQSNGGNDEVFEPGEWVQFYGQALDDEPATVLNQDNGGTEDLFAVRDFTDETTYFLTLESGLQSTMPERDADPGGSPVAPHFQATARTEIDDFFYPLPGELWYSEPIQGETSPIRTEIVELPGLATGTSSAQVRVRLRGASACFEVDPDHATRVYLANDLAQTLELPTDNDDNDGNENVGVFDGNVLFTHEFGWQHSPGDPELTDPLSVTLYPVDIDLPCPSIFGGNVRNDVILDWIEVDYDRAFTAVGDLLTFDYPDGNAEFEIDGLSGPEPEVYEITGLLAGGSVDAVRLTGASVNFNGSSWVVRFAVENDSELEDGTLRRFVVVGDAGVSVPGPGEFEPDRVSDLMTDTTQADLVVIAHPDLLDSRCSEGGGPCAYDADCTASPTDVCEIDPASELALFLDHRASQGISSRVVRIGDVEDEFNHGLPGPLAIQSFLGWVFGGGWDGEPPYYVILLGDGSYDYKAGTSEGNYVSTQVMIKDNEIFGHYASDNLLANVVGEGHLPEMVVGRFNARALWEAEVILQKILGYELEGLPGTWNSTAAFISDRGKGYDEFEALEFERINRIGSDLLDGTPYTYHELQYWSGNCLLNNPPFIDCDPVSMNQDIIACINSGVAMAQFTGHGNFDLWSDDVFFCANEEFSHPRCVDDDTEQLSNGFRMPWLVVHNCLTGGFHKPDLKSFGEQWLKRDGGGAVSVFAPSGLGFRWLGEAVTDQIWGDVFGGDKIREMAIPVMNSLVRLCGQGAAEGCQFYTLLGDPTLTLRLPHVEPASELGAVASTGPDAYIDLSWSPSATPGAEYLIYRTDDLDFDFEPLIQVPGTSHRDQAVEHTQEYFYYVVAVLDGFESAWSNFQTDCDAAEPEDCVTAIPLNFQPPAVPGGLAATDAETGGRLDVTWISNDEPDFHYYTLHYGPTAEMEQSITLFGAGYDSIALGGLQNGTTYYVGLSGTNTSGTESAIAGPVEAVPTLLLGERSPGLITNLRLARSGQDALLTWSPVTEDVYHKPESVDFYEVFRGTTPQFMPAPENRIGQPSTPTFLDVGALAPGAPDYHYLVRAVDVDGNVGGLGRQLPAGVLDLTLSRPGGGSLLLEWSAVTTDMDNRPTEISHYEVYAHDAPFGRSDIRDGHVGLLTTVAGETSLQIVPEASNRYYSVLAVDVRGNLSPF